MWALIKLKAFADNKIKFAKFSVRDRVENIVRKGQNAGYQYFFFSHSVFKTYLPRGCLNSGLCYKVLTFYHTIPTFDGPEKDGF